MSDTTIDTIFAEFGRKCSPVATLKNVDNPLVRREYIDQAKSALYELMLKEVIGTQEIYDITDASPDFIAGYNNMAEATRIMRAEQRNKLKELMK